MLGAAKVKVEHRGLAKMLAVVVAKGSEASLLERGWLKALKVDWQVVHKIEKTYYSSVETWESY